MIDYKEAKKRISIISILLDWGYKFDKTKGSVSPNFVLRDEHGREIDRVIISNPTNSEQQGFWRRNGSKGDLIIFIKENINRFGLTGRNETDTVTRILEKLMNVEEDKTLSSGPVQQHKRPENNDKNKLQQKHPGNKDLHQWLDQQGIGEAKVFDPTRYERKPAREHIDEMMTFFESRGIARETVEDFAPCIELVTPLPYPTNIGFPYRVPGTNAIAGYELRGFRGFKGKAEGTNSRSGLWLADFSDGRPSWVRKVFFFESALDAMAFYQLKQDELRLEQCVFASTGGSFSDQQVTGTMDRYSRAVAVDCFDNDLQGRIYGCRMIALLEGGCTMDDLKCRVMGDVVTFCLNGRIIEIAADLLDQNTFRAMTGLYKNKVEERKAPNNLKDWNEALLKNKD